MKTESRLANRAAPRTAQPGRANRQRVPLFHIQVPQGEVSWAYRSDSDATLFCCRGVVWLFAADEVSALSRGHTLSPGQIVRLPAGSEHRMLGLSDAELMLSEPK